MGSIYRRGNVLWIKYYRGSKTIRESAKKDNKNWEKLSEPEREKAAQKLLDLRQAQVKTGTLPPRYLERVTFDEIAQDFLNDYKVNGRASIRKAEESVKKLKEHFSGRKVKDISTSIIQEYVLIRQEQKKKNGTINRQLAALKRMLTLAARHEPPKVARVPYIPMLSEAGNARSGFFEHEDYLALRGAVPDYLKPVVAIGYHTGFRREEILTLTWEQVDLDRRRITLKAADTKTNEARMVVITDDLHKVLTAWKARRDECYPSWPLVCYRVKNKQPVPVGDFRKVWQTALKKIGLEGRLFHDFRRSAIRQMMKAGIPEKVAMMISGHKTRSVFDRYHIVNEADLDTAADKLNALYRHNSGTMAANEGATPSGQTTEVAGKSTA
jgi:integrase